MKKILKPIIFLPAIGIIIAASFAVAFVKNNQIKNEQASQATEIQIDEQQKKIAELESFKNEQQAQEQALIAEKQKKEEEAKIQSEKRAVQEREDEIKSKLADECENRKITCENKIEEAKKIKFDGDYEDVPNLDDVDSQIKELKDLMERWKGQTDCDRSDDKTKGACDDLDKRTNKVEEDIDDIKKLAKEAKSEIAKIEDDSECKDYKKTCE